ncbi:MAG: hypothetical protein GC162_05175 [Planctomycetes bacterium]|nr:hypothetical protein [Planctomycetota bacterium]
MSTIGDLSEESSPLPALDRGTAIFGATLDDGNRVLYEALGPGNIILLADQNTAAPGGGAFNGGFRDISIYDGNVAFRAGVNGQTKLMYYDGFFKDFHEVATTTTPVDLIGGGTTSVQFPNDVSVGPQGVIFNGSPTISSGRGLYFWNGTSVKEIAPPTEKVFNPTLTSQGAFYSGGPIQERLQRVDPGTASLSTVLDNTTPIPDGSGQFTQYESLSARDSGMAFFGFSGTGGNSGFYALIGGSTDPILIVNNTSVRPTGGNFSNFGDLAFGTVTQGKANVLFTEDGTLYHALSDGTDMTYTPLLSAGDQIDGRTIAGIRLSKDAFDGRHAIVYTDYEDGGNGLYYVDLENGADPDAALPRRGFHVEAHLEHHDDLTFLKVLPDTVYQVVSNIDEVVDDRTFASVQRKLTPSYNLQPPGAVADVSFDENFARVNAEATEQELPFMPGVFGPVVRAISAAQYEKSYNADINSDPELRRRSTFTEVQAIAKAVSYYRAIGGNLGDPTTVGLAFTFDGFLQADDGTFPPLTDETSNNSPVFPHSEISLKISVTVDGRTAVLFDGAAFTVADVARNGRGLNDTVDPVNTFLLEKIPSASDVNFWSVNVSRFIENAFEDVEHFFADGAVHVGDLVALQVELTTNVSGVGGLLPYGGPTLNGDILPNSVNGAFSDFFNTLQAGLFSNTDGIGLILVDENGRPIGAVPEPTAGFVMLSLVLISSRRLRR